MSFVDFVKEIVFKIDSSEKTNKVLTIFQASAAASIGVYTIYAESQPDIARLSIYTFWIFQSIILLYFVGMLAISEKYRAIKLRLRRTTGALYDKTTDFRNVSLRNESLKIIIDGIENSEKSYEIGKHVGANFYSCYEELLQRDGKLYSVDEKELESKCEHNPNPSYCIFTLEPAN